MSNQEIKNKSNTKEQAAVDKRRRFIKSAGIAAPVVLSLSSPSVFGALCLSEIMSGNQSHTGTGSCALGQNPVYWRNPANKTAWTAANFVYGNNSSATNCSAYNGGTRFNDSIAFGANALSTNPRMRELVCSSPTTLNAYLVAALLNASTPGSNYLYTAAQVRQLQKKTLGVPPNNSTNDSAVLNFLISTMNS
ncbi:MAG: hypothetical protein PHY16_09635 [Methylobacter sp.]|nr:hypothetical protein [Methylobacter sp.]